MSRRPFVRAICAILAGALIAGEGCGPVLAPRPDRSDFFVLTPISASAAQAAPSSAAARALVIGLGPITLPGYLKRREIVTRVPPNRLELSARALWAEPLDSSFRSVLAANLTTLLGGAQIIAYPWYSTTHVNYQVEVTVERFEQVAGGGAELSARWMIRDGKSKKLLLTEQTADSRSVGGMKTAASVAALSKDLGNLSDQIANAIRQLQLQRQSQPSALGVAPRINA